MGDWIRNLFLLSFLIFLYVSGVFIFTKGFLLKRIVVEQNSSCHTEFSMQIDQHGEEGCWMHKRFRKAIIVVIDALRLDFLTYDPSITNENLPPYKNKLPIVRELMFKTPNKARLYRFLADPPTTTLQRLKGLTTGSLPTFVDAGTNFGSLDISEDNVIDQLVKSGRRIKFLGDDTWMGLFPGRFTKSYPFPSFNVKDLHTVDNGILKHLMPEMKKRDWDVIIAHFLGVDHCGHRYGPNHPAMGEKLTQMNKLISNITKQMGDDTVLFVMGDHGMTWTGDHGGDSMDELEAGLFVYSPVQLTSSAVPQEIETVSQIDLVPTLALLLGVPIPFSNLGHIITDFFNHCPWWHTDSNEIKQDYHVVKALRLNAIQISHYLDAYSKLSSDFSEEKRRQFSLLLSYAENDLQKLLTDMVKDGETTTAAYRLKILTQHYTEYIKDVQETCRSIWAKFDLVSIALGIITILNAVVLNLCLVMQLRSTTKLVAGRFLFSILSSAVFIAYTLFQTFWIESDSASMMSFLLGTVNLVICLFHIKQRYNVKINYREKNWILQDSVIVVAVCGIYFSLFFSNSFVVYEDSIAQFVTQTLIWVYCVKGLHKKLSSIAVRKDFGVHTTRRHKAHHYKVFDIMHLLSHPASVVIQVAVLLSVCVRLTTVTRSCREEQVNCSHSILLQPLANLDHNSAISKNVRYFVSISCLAHSTYMIWHWFKHYGNLNGASMTVLCAKYGFPLAAVVCAFHWCLQGLPNTILDTLPPWQQTIMARLVYIIIIISIFSIICNPLCVYILPKQKDSITLPVGDASDEAVISHVYKQLKERMQRQTDENQDQRKIIPVVYGLGTVTTAAVLYISTCLVLLVNLLLGDGLGHSILLAILCVACFLELHTAKIGNMATGLSSEIGLAVITMSSLCTVFFYGTGHQATVSSIRWEAAFTGFHGDFMYNIIPAILIQLNTFASEVIFTAAMPLLVTWPYYGGVLRKLFENKKENTETWRGDLILFDDGVMFQTLAARLSGYIFLFKGIKLFGSMCAAALHRRHLMVWKIFAPRFVFEVMSSLTVFIISIFMYLFLLRLYKALEKWTERLESS